ncbi:MAG TPA: phytoene/squalene synthase family protein [Xanthobacteraceae bacterium]|nr:phytoene/squalene synthase family protein [Xanthobacteraceae bacterium]
MQDAFLHCEELVRTGDKDRYLATLFAPAKYRRALFALYAFNFEIARVREVAHEAMAGEIRLQWWSEVLSGSGRGEVAAHPVAAALRDVVVRYALPPRTLADLIEARRFDLYNEPMPDMTALEAYAARTSSALMELAARILSDGRDPGSPEFLRHAGIAYAIGGLLASFAIHALRGQLYVPLEVLNRHRARATDVYSGKSTIELRAALAEMRLHARAHLSAAHRLANDISPSVAPAVLPVVLVKPTLARMERRLYRPFQVARLAQWRRQWILWRAARAGLKGAL